MNARRLGAIISVLLASTAVILPVALSPIAGQPLAAFRAETSGTMAPTLWLPITRKEPPAWLTYLNSYRSLAKLPPLTENPSWSNGCWNHARYMVKNNVPGHTEDPALPWYTPEGLAAAQESNLWVNPNVNASDESPFDGWMSGPFHTLPMLNPAWLQTGYGSYREPFPNRTPIDNIQAAACLDTGRGIGQVPVSVNFPIQWPAADVTVPIWAYTGGELPDPLVNCPGYSPPTGLPIILRFDTRNLTPLSLTAHSFAQGNTALEHCTYNLYGYAIVLIPRLPLIQGSTFNVSLTVNDQPYAWSFIVAAPPPTPTPLPGSLIVSVTSPVLRGQQASLSAKTSPGTLCTLKFFASGGSQVLTQNATADSSGSVSWTWTVPSGLSPGTARAEVTCGAITESVNITLI